MRLAVANGEPPETRCAECPIRDLDLCPELDDLSRRTLHFSNVWDHEAHDGYRERFAPYIFPALSPGEVYGFLARRQVIVNTYREIQSEESKRQQKAAEHASQPAT